MDTSPGVWNGYQSQFMSGHIANGLPETVGEKTDPPHPDGAPSHRGHQGRLRANVRLLKHWNGTHSKPMCSWNIKALCLGCLDEPMPLINALQVFFTYAADEIDKGPTPDPAGPIPLNMPRREVHKRLCPARKYIDLMIEHEKAGIPLSAQYALHQVLPDLVPDADGTEEEADRLARTVRSGGTAATGSGSPPVSSHRRGPGPGETEAMSAWNGAQPVWWAPLERDARRHFGDDLRNSYRRNP
ncbi:hypothetical protein [Streptomyces sp. NPDC001658]